MYSWLPLFKVTIFNWLKVLSNLHIHCTSIILLVERTPVLDWRTSWSNHCSWRKVHPKWSDDLPILNSSFVSPSWEIFLFQSDGGIFSCLYPSYWSYNNRNLPWNREIKNILPNETNAEKAAAILFVLSYRWNITGSMFTTRWRGLEISWLHVWLVFNPVSVHQSFKNS